MTGRGFVGNFGGSFQQLVNVRSFAPSDDDESRIGNQAQNLGSRVDKSPLAFFGAQHCDHSKKGGISAES